MATPNDVQQGRLGRNPLTARQLVAAKVRLRNKFGK